MPLDTISNSARAALAAINAQLAEATAIRDEAQQVYDRLAPAAERLEGLVGEHQVELRAMIDGSVSVGTYTDRLLRSNELSAEITALRSEVDLDVVRAARTARDQANEHLAELSNRHTAVLYGAAEEAARDWVQRYATPALIQGLLQLSVVQALAVELRGRGELNVSYGLDEMIRVARDSIGVRGDREVARRLLAELAKNPEAGFVDIGSPAVETVFRRANLTPEPGDRRPKLTP
jgi:hypothetical protein